MITSNSQTSRFSLTRRIASRKKLRRWIALTLLLSLLIVVVLLTDTQLLARLIISKVAAPITEQGVALQVEDPQLQGLGIRGSSILISSRTHNFMLEGTKPYLAISLRSLLFGTTRGDFALDAYNGKARINFDIEGNEKELWRINFEDLHLSEHRDAAAIGITKGTLSATFSDIMLSEGNLEQMNFTASMQGLTRRKNGVKKLKVPSLWAKSKIPLPLINQFLPALSNGSLKTEGTYTHGVLSMETLRFDSSLGTLDAERAKVLFSTRSVMLDFNLLVTLTDAGKKALGFYLPILCRGGLPQNGSSELTIRIKGDSRFPAIKCR